MAISDFTKQAFHVESYVAEFIVSQGWTILARNFRRVGSELDIVAMKKQTLVVIEVKWRRQKIRFGEDLRALVGGRKMASLRRGCQAFLVQERLNPEHIRFDLAIVTPGLGRLWQLDYRVGVA